MKSLINGVCGRFKRIIPNVITVHCVAHRLALGVKCLKQDEDFVGVNTVVHRIISFLTGSGNRLNFLEKNEIEMLELDLRLIKPHDIRWLSHFSVLRRLLELYPAIIQTLIDIGYFLLEILIKLGK